MAFDAGQRGKLASQINVTPLVDVMLVLLIIFMVTAPIIQQGVEVSIPKVKAAALNHHDVWTLRGVGISADRLPIVLGCDAAGIDPDGNEVVVHAVIGDPDAGGGDETLDPRRSLLSERHDGVFAERVCVPRRRYSPISQS